jgi:pimeloyl-ACP methyl ester carboxylesterase
MPNSMLHRSELAPPALRLLAREMASFAYMRIRATFAPAVDTPVVGTGEYVLVIPGFMASDRTTSRLRRSLDKAGFISMGWGLGRNRGIRADTLEQLDACLSGIANAQSVTLVGWSLGGLIAREYAKLYPARVARVVTLGSPFSGDPRANNAWRIYEFVAGHKVDCPPIPAILHEKPPVPTTAFWSRSDGIVAPASARGAQDERDHQIELNCRHMAFVADPAAITAIIAEVATGNTNLR